MIPLAAVCAVVCSILCLCLDLSHFTEYKLSSLLNLIYSLVLFCRFQPGFYSYNRRVVLLFMQDLRPFLLLFIFKKVGINEQKFSRKTLWVETTVAVSCCLFCGTVYFALSQPLIWLSLDLLSGWLCRKIQILRKWTLPTDKYYSQKNIFDWYLI